MFRLKMVNTATGVEWVALGEYADEDQAYRLAVQVRGEHTAAGRPINVSVLDLTSTRGVAQPHATGGVCDLPACNVNNYDGHEVWDSVTEWDRDHHADGSVCERFGPCGMDVCRKSAA